MITAVISKITIVAKNTHPSLNQMLFLFATCPEDFVFIDDRSDMKSMITTSLPNNNLLS